MKVQIFLTLISIIPSFAAAQTSMRKSEITVKFSGVTDVKALEGNANAYIIKLREETYEAGCGRISMKNGRLKCDSKTEACLIKFENEFCQVIPSAGTCEGGSPRLAKRPPVFPIFKFCKSLPRERDSGTATTPAAN